MIVQDYHPCERAALIAISLKEGAYLTTEDLMSRFDIGHSAAKRDFQRLQRVLPITFRWKPARYGNFKQWYWIKFNPPGAGR